MNKKKVFSIAVIGICLSVASAGTLAYFTDAETAHNVITTGNIDVKLLETTADGTDFANVTGVVPGGEVSKIVQVKNIGANAAYVRMRVDKDITLANGQDGQPDLDLLNISYNTADWTEADGYYYYNKTLEAGNSTEPLFERVKFDSRMDNRYQNSTASVYVYVEATQADHNGERALEANGWPDSARR